MTLDPFRGIPIRRGLTGSTVPVEESGFAVLTMHPNAAYESPKAKITFFPRWQSSFFGDVTQRRRATISLHYAEIPYGHLPFYFELSSEQQKPGEPYEILHLYVDRDVSIVFPQETKANPANAYRIPFKRQGVQPAHTLHVYIYRIQNRASVPQSPVDVAGLLSPSIIRYGTSVRYRIGQAQRTQTGREFFPFCAYVSTADGGTRMVLGIETRYSQASVVGTGQLRTPSREILAVINVKYFRAKHPGAYHIEAQPTRDNLRVTVTMDRNTYARMGAAKSLAAPFVGFVQDIRSQLTESGIELRFAYVARNQVPRPGHAATEPGAHWYESDQLHSRIRLYPMASRSLDAQLALVDIGIGMLPIIGDLYDIGQLAYVIVTGHDFWRRRADNVDLLFYAVALLPIIPSGLRRIRNFDARRNRARKLFESSELGLERVRRAVKARRPYFDSLVEHVSSAGEAFQMSRAVAARGMLRDEELRHLSRFENASP